MLMCQRHCTLSTTNYDRKSKIWRSSRLLLPSGKSIQELVLFQVDLKLNLNLKTITVIPGIILLNALVEHTTVLAQVRNTVKVEYFIFHFLKFLWDFRFASLGLCEF